jgi:hypothetical protein
VGGTNSASYTVVRDKYRNTTAKILSGRYSNKAVDYQGRILTQTVDTGWSPMTTGTSSDILTLWGMTNTLGSDKTDTYALSMSYDPGSVPSTLPRSGKFGLATPGADGKWVNAADRNIGGRKKFVFGPYNTRYLLGTYGVDTKTNTAWAVVNYDGAFAVVRVDRR